MHVLYLRVWIKLKVVQRRTFIERFDFPHHPLSSPNFRYTGFMAIYPVQRTVVYNKT